MFGNAVCEVLFHYHGDFHLCMSRHTLTEISMLMNLNLAHGVAEHTAEEKVFGGQNLLSNLV